MFVPNATPLKISSVSLLALTLFSSILPTFLNPHSEKYPDRVAEPIYQERPDIRRNENEEAHLQTRLTGAERKVHPWGPEMAYAVDKFMTQTEPIFNSVRRSVIEMLKGWGVKERGDDGKLVMTTPHWGSLTSKVASDVYHNITLPALLKSSQWGQRYPDYNFRTDPSGLLKNKLFTDSMMGLYKQTPPPFSSMALSSYLN
jgi:hypothetical protein